MIDLNTLLVDVIKKKMSGNTHHDYSNLMNLLHTLAESKFFFGDVNISELAVKWKEVVEMKGRQLRRKKLIQVPYTVDGYTVELTDFADSEAMSLRHIYTDTESDSVSRRTTKSRGTKRSSEADSEKTTKRRRKRAAAPPASDESHLAVRLNVQQVDGRAVYSFSEVVDQTPVVAKTRGRKPRATAAASAGAEEKDFARKVKKPQFEVYFDLSSEINKMSYNMYRENWQNYPREKWYCCVCFGDDDMPQNPMLRCACCGCIVHKYCYGVDPLPSNPSEWLCDYCQYVKDNGLTWKGQVLVGMGRGNDRQACPLCYFTGGCYKKTVTNSWVHVLCAVWASEIRFGDELHMRNVSGIESIPDNMRKYKCFLCHKTGSYVLTVGEREGCERSACIRCARSTSTRCAEEGTGCGWSGWRMRGCRRSATNMGRRERHDRRRRVLPPVELESSRQIARIVIRTGKNNAFRLTCFLRYKMYSG